MILFIVCLLSVYAQEISIDLTKRKGLAMTRQFRGTPDPEGILNEIPLQFPEFSKGAYFSADGGGSRAFLAGNRNHLWIFDPSSRVINKPSFGPKVPFGLQKSPAGRQGSFTLLMLSDGRYLCMLPLAGPESISWIEFEEGHPPVLKAASLGTDEVSGPLPLLAWASSDDLYEASWMVWQQVLENDVPGVNTTWRSKKEYPEVFRYLGWASWEEYWFAINDSVLTSNVRKINESGVPVRFFLVDAGHQTASGKDFNVRLKSFSPDPVKFPRGWEPLVSMKDQDQIKWMGLWHHMSGYIHGIDENNDFGELNKHLTRVKSGVYIPAPDDASMEAFYSQLFGSMKQAGFDFTKVDFQTPNLAHYIGEKNAVRAHSMAAASLESSVHGNGLELLNCIAQDMVSILNTRHSNVTRCSQDYVKGSIQNARVRTFQSYNNMLWMGHTVWGDHDMFHTDDCMVSGSLMAICRAMSGGPVYFSDHPDHFQKEYILPLCYRDGEVIRPLAPAVPLPESVFNNPLHERESYRVIAPLPNRAASVVCYNLLESVVPQTLASVVCTRDYQYASALEQPYPGPNPMPEEGMVIYDWYSGKICQGEEFHFKLTKLSDRLFHLCPIDQGVAVIGRTDKYLSPATVSDVQVEKRASGDRILSFSMKESGPFALYLDGGLPSADRVVFKQGENGLWTGIPPVGITNYRVLITLTTE
jgi:hypothetical protein